MLLLAAVPAAAQTTTGGTAGSPAQSATRGPAGPASPQAPPRGWTFDWQRHPAATFGDTFRIEARARFQFDARDTDIGLPTGEDTWKIALKRIGAAGSLFRAVDFQVDRELVRDAGWRDVWVGWRPAPDWQVRAGQMKLPVGLDENTPLTVLDFVYRSQTSRQLAPGRDPGVMVSGRVARSFVRFDAGVFTHDGKNARRPNSTRVQAGTTVAARVRVQPFRRTALALRTLEAGASMATGVVPEGVDAMRGRTPVGLTFFSVDDRVAGRRTRTGLELRWQPGPFSLNSEWIRVSTARDGLAPGGGDLAAVTATGWHAGAAWVVTGQPKASLVSPSRGIGYGPFGAVEVAARIEHLRFRAPAPSGAGVANGDRILTTGVTWVLNAWLRMQVNVVREHLDHAIAGTAPARTTFWGRVFRLQFAI
ncbi:MAG: porin [Vicinamibacterales bacterium]